MEKYLTIKPSYSEFEDFLKDFNGNLFFDRKLWWKYGKHCNVDTNVGYIEHLDWKDMMVDLPESIELYKVSGECIGIHKNVPYPVFLDALIENGFCVPPFGTGIFLPLEFKRQNIVIPNQEEINVFSPIPPLGSKRYKSWHIKLNYVITDFCPEGKIIIHLEHLRPTETWISPKTIWTVQNISNK